MPKVQQRRKVSPRQLIDGVEDEETDQGGQAILTDEHRIAIAQLILENKEIIKGQGKSLQIKADKNKVWKQIYDHAISLGAVIPNLKHLRKVKFFCRKLRIQCKH
jgi:hypothetical protein